MNPRLPGYEWINHLKLSNLWSPFDNICYTIMKMKCSRRHFSTSILFRNNNNVYKESIVKITGHLLRFALWKPEQRFARTSVTGIGTINGSTPFPHFAVDAITDDPSKYLVSLTKFPRPETFRLLGTNVSFRRGLKQRNINFIGGKN